MMMTKKTMLALTLVALSGCRKETAPAPTTPATPSATTSEIGLSANESRSLALMAPEGDSAADRIVRRTQADVNRVPGRADGWVLLGRAWVRKARGTSDPGFYLNARAAADVALALSPDSIPALNLRGLVFLNNHEFVAARDLATKIHKRYADDAMALGTLSDAQLELGDYAAAGEAARKMMQLKPNLPSYARASHLAWLHGDVAGAKEAMRLAFDAGRGQRDHEPASWTLVEAADIFFNEGDYDGADAGYTLALSYYPDYPPALVGSGKVAMTRGDSKRAAALFDQAFEASPLAKTAWLLGDARTAVGDKAGARKAYRQVEKIGRMSDHRTLVAFYTTKDRNVADALRMARAEAKARGGIQSLDGLAWALYRSGHFAEAKKASDAAMRLGTPDARLIFHAGAIRIAAGEAEQGKALVRKALALNPQFDYTGSDEARVMIRQPISEAQGGRGREVL